MSRIPLLFLLSFVTFGAIAQDDDACAEPTDKKVLKLLSEAKSAKDPMEGHRKLKASLEEDPGCARCLFETGKSAYFRAKAGGIAPDAAKRWKSISATKILVLPKHLV